MRSALPWLLAVVAGLAPGAEGQDASPAADEPAAVAWDAEGLPQLPVMLAKAHKAGKRLLVGLSGGAG